MNFYEFFMIFFLILSNLAATFGQTAGHFENFENWIAHLHMVINYFCAKFHWDASEIMQFLRFRKCPDKKWGGRRE